MGENLARQRGAVNATGTEPRYGGRVFIGSGYASPE